ncbi:hypothetical protein SK128_002798 [Halocaridina rubra]|uniref:Chitin-binding type-2 domain-containing protein n=1 Tax=Halocaridina rubra TaxID=373956 RepID=A0AAN8XK75_HALRR
MAKGMLMIILALVGYSSAQVGYDFAPPRSAYGAPDQRAEESVFEEQQEEDPIAVLASLIPRGGIPGESYPILSSIPETGFDCANQEYPGYYADVSDDAKCQVFHICQFDGRLDSFLCPNGTVFNQQYFVCDWWFNVDCSASQDFTRLNADIGKLQEPVTEASFRNEVFAPDQLYGTPEVRQFSAPAPPPPAPTTQTIPNGFYGVPNGF